MKSKGFRIDAQLMNRSQVQELRDRYPEAEFRNEAFGQDTKLAKLMDCFRVDKSLCDPSKTVLVLWSGGLDSTGLVANLLKKGYDVLPLHIASRHGPYFMREVNRMTRLHTILSTYGMAGTLHPPLFKDLVPVMEAYRTSKDLVPNRNELFVQYASTVMKEYGITQLGSGEYIGADKWVITYHVPTSDTEPVSFEKWLNYYVGPESRFWYLDDFGKAVYKNNRLAIGWEVIGEHMNVTTCCLSDTYQDCGICYGCIQRVAAFDTLNLTDLTDYGRDPRISWLYPYYRKQMEG